eukprot:TRINITY_DN2415_c0_g1_i3.p2 TRINITY_DN2415_c0_g1~~TRINITY_DN2415_c0_g1_i3.p2  ORF type:complete len:277 (-),score=15.66 TRINITY_DN2415_c0_g1_i3:1102-1932(-)
METPLSTLESNKDKYSSFQGSTKTSWVYISYDRLSRILHCSCCVIFMGVWLWHFTPQASSLPGANLFGWFFRYLTFCTYTLQTFWLLLSTLSWLLTDSDSSILNTVADDLACTLFPLANVVTVLYYTLEIITQGLVEGGDIARPPWLGFAVHGMNSIVAWLDLLFSRPRKFSRRAKFWGACLAISYFIWMVVMKRVGGGFPYPFLDKMPFPEGFLVMTMAGCMLYALLFVMGNLLKRMVDARAVIVQVKQPQNRGILFLDLSGAAIAAAVAICVFR